jgi:hypothetical protein
MPPHNNENNVSTTMKWKHYYGYASEIDKRFSSSEEGVEFWNAKI